MDEAPRRRSDAILGFVIWAIVAFALGILLCFVLGTTIEPRGFVLGGLVQLVYIVPLCWRAWRRNDKGMLAGLISAASIVMLLSVQCELIEERLRRQ